MCKFCQSDTFILQESKVAGLAGGGARALTRLSSLDVQLYWSVPDMLCGHEEEGGGRGRSGGGGGCGGPRSSEKRASLASCQCSSPSPAANADSEHGLLGP
jgi:hypothetical protein